MSLQENLDRILADVAKGYEMRPDLKPAPGYLAFKFGTSVPVGMCPMTAACVANGFVPDANRAVIGLEVKKLFGLTIDQRERFFQAYDMGGVFGVGDVCSEYGMKARELFPPQ